MSPARVTKPQGFPIDDNGSRTHSEGEIKTETLGNVEPALVLYGHRRYLRGRRGGLKDLPQMPLDVVFEVLSHLTPRDLLSLARSTKDFRKMLMSRRSACLWKQSRKQLQGLPEPPSFLCEPAYANLLFSPQCHRCLKPNINTVIWSFSARYCNPCKKIMFTTDHKEVEALIREVMGKAYHTESSLSYVRRHQGKCHKDEIEAIKKRWALLQTEEERDDFRAERKAFVAECERYGALLPQWKQSYNEQMYHEKFALRTARGNAIKGRLREEGWGDVVDHFNVGDKWKFSTLKEVNRTTKLTESGWLKVRQSMLDFVTPIRPRYFRMRLAKACEARASVIRTRENKAEKMYAARFPYLQDVLDVYQVEEGRRTAESDQKPGFADFAYMPPFKNLIQTETDATKDCFLALQPQILDLIRSWTDRWQAVFTRKALDGLNKAALYIPLETNTLELAVVSFVCTLCQQRQLRWPRVLAHRCFRRKPETLIGPEVKKQYGVYGTAILRYIQHDHDARFQGEKYTAFNQNVTSMRAVIIACGFDPQTATYEDLETCEVRLRCSLCVYLEELSPQRLHVFSWQAAIEHSISCHAGMYAEGSDCWDRVLDDDVSTATELELDALPVPPHTVASMPVSGCSERVLGCTQCNYHGNYSEIHEHLLFAHWMYKLPEDLVLDEDFYVHSDSKESYGPLSVWMQLPRDIIVV